MMIAGAQMVRQIQTGVFDENCNVFMPLYRQISMPKPGSGCFFPIFRKIPVCPIFPKGCSISVFTGTERKKSIFRKISNSEYWRYFLNFAAEK